MAQSSRSTVAPAVRSQPCGGGLPWPTQTGSGSVHTHMAFVRAAPCQRVVRGCRLHAEK